MSALRNAIHREKCWTRNPINNADEGKIYERLVAVSTFLTLKDGQEMICEVEEAGNFDDVVLWVENDGYYLRQIKHKQQSNFEIRESNLFPSKPRDMFSLDLYISSFAKQICKTQPFARDISLIKELTLTTNVDFDPSLMQYLESAGPNNVWPVLDDTIRNERFIFKPSKFHEIRKKLRNPDKFDDHTINLFLEKIVFEVKYPSISALKAWIKRKLRLLIPLKLSDDQIEKATEILQKNFNDYFYNSMENSAGWADSQLRKPILLSILTHLKATLKIGSTLNYEGKSLLPILGEIKSIDFPLGILEKFEESIKKGNFDTLNIVVLPKECFPILTSSKILSYFRRKDKYNLNMVWIVDVKSEDDGLELANIFGHWNIEIFTGFVFAVEFSQELCEKGTSSRIAQQIFDRLPNKHLLEFIFITTQAMNTIGNTGLVQELYDSLSYEGFTENIRHRLIQKLLSIKDGPLLSLELLGIDLAFLDSLSLSELILADGKDQLDLLLPSYDDDLEKVYIPRKLRIPVLSKVDVNDGVKMERDSICSIRHLHRSLKTLEIAPGQSAEFPRKSNVGDYGAVVDENVLIVDGPLFDESNKVAIVVGMPGMGKSTLLTYLSKALLRNSQKSMQNLVIRTNLGNCPREAWETPLNTATDLVRFFFSQTQNNKSKQPLVYLSKRIVEEICRGRSCWSVIIMLDGFDEISYRGRSFISEKLIPLLMPLKGVYRIIVTSRPDGVVREKLESVFNGLALHIVELDSHDQEAILVSLWCKSISKENLSLLIDHSSVMERCRAFAKRLVCLARHQLTDKDKTILDVPLQCALFAECFYVDLKNYVERNCSLLGTDYNFNFLGLFETFIENKFNILFREKEMLEVKNDRAQEMYETRQKSSVRSAMRISVYLIIRDKEKAEHLLGKKWNERKFNEDMEQMKALGFVAYFNDDAFYCDGTGPSFGWIHCAFAEYLVAKYLIDAFTEQQNQLLASDNPVTYEIVLDIILLKNEYEGVRRFFDRMLEHCLPDFTKGCPFASGNRCYVVSKWALLSHERFNTFLAKTMTRRGGDIFAISLNCANKSVDKRNIKHHYPSQVIWLLMLCLKEYFSRNRTANTKSLAELSLEQTLSFFLSKKAGEHSI